jgi:hypothetical protein
LSIFKTLLGLYRDEFIEEVRKVLGVPEWMLTYDNRQTKDVYGGECLQMLFHFRGTINHEYAISHLIKLLKSESKLNCFYFCQDPLPTELNKILIDC